MKNAYLYVRVSTDEQKRKGFSLIEQEDRLLKFCAMNQITVKGIFREDFSAKDFNRPEWRNLIKTIKKNKHRPPENILFVKWDRFSRNIEYAYQMIGILRGLNTQAMAIDQVIDFEVPESTVMLAMYLSIPEAENSRRGLNTSDGIRRARKMGRWPGKAPMGYINKVAPDGKKIIIPKHPEADYIRWSFEEYSKGKFTISYIRRMANLKGLICGRNNFWKVLHNPLYCGLVFVPAYKMEEEYFVEGLHEPLISEKLFKEVQCLLNSRRTKNSFKQKMKPVFLLRGFLTCPYCNKPLTGSTSTGRYAKYQYYHCAVRKCKARIRTYILDFEYEELLKKINIKPEVYELLELVLEDENILTVKRECINEQKKILKEISDQELIISKARRHFIQNEIDFEDFKDLKTEYKQVMNFLSDRLTLVSESLNNCNTGKNIKDLKDGKKNVLTLYKSQDIAGKQYIIELFTPLSFDPLTKKLNHLHINHAISMITTYSDKYITSTNFINTKTIGQISNSKPRVFSDRKVSINQVMKILKKNGIETTVAQAKEILDFLYTFTKLYSKQDVQNISELIEPRKGISNL
ncbi:recombinase family protein [Flavobacterium algoritolerans]|uniref:Recombinase family protein n=1 Tax=Flavobacterium algoritolerans TaxID=3041254 RepID=A0ABT6VEY4_9FLAO|nr:recombinase family protein [Flavobacterium algoritolerans]MDI5896013.1 recombinase family protein [Flavobacterium algoritolerans]